MNLRQNQTWTIGGAFLLALLMALPVLAADAAKPKATHIGGKITAVSATSITVQPKTGDAKTFTINADTKVTLDRKPATAADLNTEENARVTSTDGTTATEITARTPHHKGGNGGTPPAATTPAAPTTPTTPAPPQ